MKIVVVDNDRNVLNLMMRTALEVGHECTTCHRGSSLIRRLNKTSFDLIILNLQLPDMPGTQVLTWIRDHVGSSVLVMFMTNTSVEEKIVAGFMAGADDYMAKPLHKKELAARLHSLARRHRVYSLREKEEHFINVETGPFHFNVLARTASVHGESIFLKPKEFDLAVLLFRSAGKIISKDIISKSVWGRTLPAASRTLDTHISCVRKKLNLTIDNNVIVRSVRKKGYRLDLVQCR